MLFHKNDTLKFYPLHTLRKMSREFNSKRFSTLYGLIYNVLTILFGGEVDL